MATTDRSHVPSRADASGTVAVGGRPLGAVWIAVLCFSAGPVLAAMADASGVLLAFWRLWMAVPLLVVVALWQMRRSGNWPGLSTVRWPLLAGVAFAVHQLLFLSSLQETSVVDVTLMNTLAPLVVAVLAVPLFDERPGLSFRAWSVVAIGGAAIVALAGSTGPDGDPIGIALAAGNVVFYALFFVVSKQSRPHLDVAPFLAGVLIVSAVVVSGWVVVTGTDISAISGRDLVLCLSIAVLPGFVGHFLMTWSLRWVPANLPPVIMLTIPVFSGVLAWFILDQHLTYAKVVGGAITLGGVFGAVRKSADLVPTAVESLDMAEEA